MRSKPTAIGKILVLVFVALAGSCDAWTWEAWSLNPLYCDPSTPCAAPARPYCDFVASECRAMPIVLVDGGSDAPIGCVATADCPAARPVCEAHTCRACAGATDDTVCATRSPMLPRCAPAGGACVACRAGTQEMDCAMATPICEATTNACRRCAAQSECASGACLVGGTCAPAGMVAIVDNGGMKVGDCNKTGRDGTKAHPYCDVQDALIAAAPLPYVVVAGSASAAYGPVILTKGTVTLFGPGISVTATARLQGDNSNDAANVSGKGADLTLDGFVILNAGSGNIGVHCAPTMGTATLTVRNSFIHDNNGAGVSATNCTVTLDANQIAKNQGGGVKLGSSSYTITNNIIAANGVGGPGVTLDNQSKGDFAFNTVASNTYTGASGGIDCGGMPKKIAYSIVVGNSVLMGSQFHDNCVLMNVVTGMDSVMGATPGNPTFVNVMNDFHLKAGDQPNTDCCVDKVMSPTTPNADHDVDSTHRPKGAAWDLGAHEVQ